MLESLVIHDVVLIDKLTVRFTAGLNVFTGETGAGKSIVLDALGLALGGRSDAGLIRHGANQASVTASFILSSDHDAFTLLDDQGRAHDGQMILRRVIAADGKSRAFVNDQAISIGLLRQLGEQLLEIHGQFDTHGLLNPATHRDLLDRFGNLQELRNSVRALHTTWQDAETRQRNANLERERAAAEENFLHAAVQELNDLAATADEPAALAAERTRLQHYEKIVEQLTAASRALDSERGAIPALAQAGKAVARVVDKSANLSELLTMLDRAAQETAEAYHRLQHVLNRMDGDPNTLQRIEERLFALRAVARKHNVAVEALPELQRDMTVRLTLITDQGDLTKQLTKQAAEARHAYQQQAKHLSDKRQHTAQSLQKVIMRELPPLKFEQANFIVDVAPLPDSEWSADGMDRVTFQAATNAGSQAGSLQKIASGGELSRFMLALKVVLAASDPVPVMVFDEVDAGIGGATASAVGERLARLATHVQILVVTHSPQVAARGNHHLRVHKSTKAKQTTTQIETLDESARVEEIARMLAGSQITDAARQAAISLINDAVTPTPATKSRKAVKS